MAASGLRLLLLAGLALLPARAVRLAAEQGRAGLQWPRLINFLGKTKYNCSDHPWMCEAPFDCQKLPGDEEMGRRKHTLATPDGHANLQSWCLAPQYAPNVVRTCLVEKDLKLSAQKVHTATVNKRFGPNTEELDASYCFMEGHCTNTAVTYNTTMEEAEAMCDYRYGHDGWAVNFGYDNVFRTVPLNLHHLNPKKGITSRELSSIFAKASCAMGNYHCDVIYCRDTYCKDPHFVEKYTKNLPDKPGHLYQQLL